MDTSKVVFNKLICGEITELGEDYVMIYDDKCELTHVLNPMMFFIWENCNGINTVDDIVSLIQYTYDTTNVSSTQIRSDCIGALEELEKKKLINVLNVSNNRDS